MRRWGWLCMAAETYVDLINAKDEAGDEFSLDVYYQGSDEIVDFAVEANGERVVLWLSVEQARQIRDGFTEALTAIHREAVRRERGSLS